MSSDIFELGATAMSDEQLLMMLGGIFLIAGLITVAVAIVAYVFQSIGLYTLAKRRGIKRPWLAWIPVGDYWIIGSISDDVRLRNKSELNHRRVWLAVLIAGTTILTFVKAWPVYRMIWLMQRAGEMDTEAMLLQMEQYLLQMESYEYGFGALLGLVANIASIVVTVLYCMSLYDLYASCRPRQKVMFTVLSVLISITIPFFI